MDENRPAIWLKRGGVAASALLVIALLTRVWLGSSAIVRDFLAPENSTPVETVEVLLVGAGRIVLPRTAATELDGIWGVIGPDGAYGQMFALISVDADTVERSFRTIEGRFRVGDQVEIDPDAFPGDPAIAFNEPFDSVRVPGELGVNPAWFIDGQRNTWVIVIHDRADDRREALRLLPILADGGFPVLVISYRNDSLAPDAGGYYSYGLNEWRDVEAAKDYARNRGAKDFILYGFGMGGTIAAMDLNESDTTNEVLGVVLDSPILDLEGAIDSAGTISGWGASLAKAVARIRFGLEWDDLDQLERADQFDVPILLLQGTADSVAPTSIADEFAAARPDLVTYERFEGAHHGELWNIDSVRYARVVLAFVVGRAGPVRR